MPDAKISGLKAAYRQRKPVIRQRLLEFQKRGLGNDSEIFSELAFCICTPQTNAKQCDAAVNGLLGKSLLKAGKPSIEKALSKKVRFHRNKASYIVQARSLLMPGIRLKLESLGVESEPAKARQWLAKNVKGLGMKEASHFLRNIGFGSDLAILDRHVLKNLLELGAIGELPKAISEKNYLHLEKSMRRFSRRVKIPMGELDLLFWSNETGEVFK
ncbi:MAG: N-glycosylase/DNA lyase [Candidatus Diapherotrites archaeon]|uniref:8-oxoguanine DNA glycosylase/AP lyase n=1 Tax=Candidatus Iainarchaeum sp. TaxID=3101447 RepID=A0A939C6H8_9ARCH|nr:N-glycosylase/DNA lyase [Candidatus Diapherotrites archaeon]